MATPPQPIPEPNPVPETKNETSKWADHLFDEWKYRHENFWRTLYRYLAAIAILIAIPFVKNEFKPMVGGLGMIVYLLLPVIIFGALCFVLTREHSKLESVETLLTTIRNKEGYKLEAKRWRTVLKERKKIAYPFIAIGSTLLVLWAIILFKVTATSSSPEHSTSEPCITVYSNH